MRIEGLGRQILPNFYTDYLGRETADYMVESGHTANALQAQAAKGYSHYLIEWNGAAVGYFSLHKEGDTMLLSRFYLLEEYRGRGLGQLAMDFIHREAEGLRAGKIELFVLRRNEAAVGLYTKNGFVIAGEVLTTLGNGAVLEDYHMQKYFDIQ